MAVDGEIAALVWLRLQDDFVGLAFVSSLKNTVPITEIEGVFLIPVRE